MIRRWIALGRHPSAMKRVDNAIYDVVRMLKDGQWKGGDTLVYNLSNEGVGIAPTSGKHVPASVLKEVEQLIARIKKGEIVVPATKDEFDKFKF